MPALDLSPADATALAELLALAGRIKHLHPLLAELAGPATPRACTVCSAPLSAASPRAALCSQRCRQISSRRNRAATTSTTAAMPVVIELDQHPAGGGEGHDPVERIQQLPDLLHLEEPLPALGSAGGEGQDPVEGSLQESPAVVSDTLTSAGATAAPQPRPERSPGLAEAITAAVADHGAAWPRGLAAAIARQHGVSSQAIDQRKRKLLAAAG